MNRFDAILKSPVGDQASWDIPIYETESFVSVPSLGSLLPGWLLVIPRRPMLNLQGLASAERTELNDLISRIVAEMAAFDGEVFAFEHGSNAVGSVTGCGFDHAHLHLVSLPFNLIEAIEVCGDDEVEWRSINRASSFFDVTPNTDGEYIGVWRPGDASGAMGLMRKSKSQWVRRVIARKLGKGDAWDYKTHPGHAHLNATITTLSGARTTIGPQ